MPRASRQLLVFVCDPWTGSCLTLKAYVRVSGCLGASPLEGLLTKSVLRLKQLLKIQSWSFAGRTGVLGICFHCSA